MIEYDNEDNPDFDFSPFDRAKIEDLEIGEKMESEDMSFIIVRERKGYRVWCAKGENTGIFILPNLEKTFEFLENN